MIGKRMEGALNEQIREELSSAYLYLSMAAYFHGEGLDGMAGWMRLQAKEELEHALKIFDHLVERGGRVRLEALPEPRFEWGSPLEAWKAAYEHERHITGRIDELVALAQEEKDNAALVMLQWFVAEQVEEEDQTRKVVEMLERIGESGRGLLWLDKELGKRKKEEK
ncbi:MAG: Ferritin and Dp [Acetothermia bacterium 64_32]|nr:MAG: Ferritin and Dp [Acetothermia bacterium 64_32]HAF69891.1 ferritin [Candidatus Acetothermia bacterium]